MGNLASSGTPRASNVRRVCAMTVLPSVRLLGQAHGHRRRPWNFGTRQQVAIAEWHIVGYDMRVSVWRADRVAEGACLLSEYSPKDYLGFESPALRQTMSAPARKIAGRRFAFYLPRCLARLGRVPAPWPASLRTRLAARAWLIPCSWAGPSGHPPSPRQPRRMATRLTKSLGFGCHRPTVVPAE